MISSGGVKPWRAHLRSPSLTCLQSIAPVVQGHYLADLIAILASLDPVMGDVDR